MPTNDGGSKACSGLPKFATKSYILLMHPVFLVCQEPGVLQWTRDNVSPSFVMFLDLGARPGTANTSANAVCFLGMAWCSSIA